MKPTNKLMKRLSRYLFLILFALQTPSQADDIMDFQIEGMSVGDSALEYYTEIKINSHKKSYYKNKKFFKITIYTEKSDYDTLGLTFKSKDKKYIMYGINGALTLDNIKECKTKKDNIIKELSKMVVDAEKVDPGVRNYAGDPTGESKSYGVYYWIKTGGFIEISCYDLTEKYAKENNWIKNTLNVGSNSKEFSDFLLNEHYAQ